MLKITKVSIEFIPEIKRLSDEIWKQVYPSVVPMAQIEFLLNTWYSTDALTEQMEQSGHQFILVEWNDEAVGYASYSMKLATNLRGSGYINFISNQPCTARALVEPC